MTGASKAYLKASTRKFRRWWAGINSHPAAKQQEILSKWLYFAKKTAALKTDQNAQTVVYTIAKRFHNSEYKKLSRENAKRVFDIINQHQDNFKAMREQLRAQWVREIQSAVPATQTTTRGAVTVKHTTNKRIISGGRP